MDLLSSPTKPEGYVLGLVTGHSTADVSHFLDCIYARCDNALRSRDEWFYHRVLPWKEPETTTEASTTNPLFLSKYWCMRQYRMITHEPIVFALTLYIGFACSYPSFSFTACTILISELCRWHSMFVDHVWHCLSYPSSRWCFSIDLLFSAVPIIYEQHRGSNTLVGSLPFLGVMFGTSIAAIISAHIYYQISCAGKFKSDRHLVLASCVCTACWQTWGEDRPWIPITADECVKFMSAHAHAGPWYNWDRYNIVIGSIAFPIGFFLLGWTSSPSIHWFPSVLGLSFIGMSFLLIFLVTLMNISGPLVFVSWHGFWCIGRAQLFNWCIHKVCLASVLLKLTDLRCDWRRADTLPVQWVNSIVQLVSIAV